MVIGNHSSVASPVFRRFQLLWIPGFDPCVFKRGTAGHFLDYLILCVDTKKFFLACGRDSFVTTVRSQKRESALDFVLACG